MTPRSGRPLAEVLVVGDGIIGLSVAEELARRGASVLLADARRPGIASEAAAGLLAPSIGSVDPQAQPFYLHSLSLFPEFAARLTDENAGRLLTHGLVELIDAGASDAPRPRARRLSPAEAEDVEPSVQAPNGAWYHPDDGAVHLPNLVAALRVATRRSASVSRLHSEAVAVGADARRPTVLLRDGTVAEADTIVLAAGAWTPMLRGLPRVLPVRPLKGEIIALDRCTLRYPVLSGHVYLVPRGNQTVVGATSEDVGFDVHRNAFVATSLHKEAAVACPSLEAAQVVEHWAGLRPVTPDMLPILGHEPEAPGIVYACGHGRNGILLAPATARAVASLCEGTDPDVSISAFAPDRPNLAAGQSN